MRQKMLSRQRAAVSLVPHAIDTRSLAARAVALFLALAMVIAVNSSRSFAAESENIRLVKAMSNAYAEIVDQASPAVVGISTEKVYKSGGSGMGGTGDESFDLFERFFDMPRGFGGPRMTPRQGPQPERRARGLGSGVIIDKEGHILTNNHVVADADSIKVELAFEKGKTRTAEIVGRDPSSDLAVIKLVDAPDNLPVLTLGDSDAMKPGNLVIAIGSPLGFKQSVTTGVVSATSRTLGEFNYERFIQTDAAINQGNSGGPLLNLDGEVIGINTIISTGGGSGSIGIGFAIPTNLAKPVIEQLIEKGSVTRGWLGIVMNQEDPEISQRLGHDGTGVLITEVDAVGPAAKAGMRGGDLIVSYDNIPIRDNEHLRYMVADTRPDTSVPVVVIRDGERVELSVTIEAQPEDMFSRARTGGKSGGPGAPGSPREETSEALGLTVQNLDDATRQRYNIPESVDTGVVVTKVEPGSDADEKRIAPGAVILEIEKQPIADVAAFRRLVDENKGRENLLFNVKMGNVGRWLLLKQK